MFIEYSGPCLESPTAIKYGLSRQVVFCDRFNCTEMWDLLTLVVLQDRWSLMAVVSHDRFHCTKFCLSVTVQAVEL